MRLLVIGASGRCGGWLVRKAVQRGYDVTAVTREVSRDAVPECARIVTGTVTDPHLLADVTRDQDVVLSCLGLRRASLSPWSRILSPPDLVESFTRRLGDALPSDGPRRVIWISAGGVGDSRQSTTRAVRALIDAGSIGLAYRDLEAAEALMPRDGRWLAVRPVTLINGAPTGQARAVERYGFLSAIRRSDVAGWMLDVADGARTHSEPTVLLGS